MMPHNFAFSVNYPENTCMCALALGVILWPYGISRHLWQPVRLKNSFFLPLFIADALELWA